MQHQLESSGLGAGERDVAVVAGIVSFEVQGHSPSGVVVTMRSCWDHSPVIGMNLVGT